MGLVSELRRRNVLRMAALYAVAAWLIVQVAGVLIDLGNLPDRIGPIILALLAIGFPIALIVSWFYEITPEGISLEKDVAPGESITHVTGRRLDFIVISLLCAAVILFAYDKWWIGPPPEKSIAVLPFVNMSGNAEQEYFSDGISEELLNLLAQIPELTVISRSSAFSFKGKDVDLRTVAEQLNVAHVLEGSVRKVGNRVRITAQLIEARSDSHLWSESYDRTLDDIFAIQDEISAGIVEALKEHLGLQVGATPRVIAAANTEAHDAYLRGRYLVVQRTPASIKGAVREFEKAVELDPDFALAHAELALATLLLGTYTDLPITGLLARATPHVDEAMALNPTLAEAHAATGYLLWYQWNLEEAQTHFEQAVQLNPNYSIVYVWMGNLLSGDLGRYAEAFPMQETTLRLDPLSIPAIANYVAGLMTRNRLAEADRELEKLASVHPATYADLRGERTSLGGKWANVVLGGLNVLRIDQGDKITLSKLTLSFAFLGLEKEALAIYEAPDPTALRILGRPGDAVTTAEARLAEDPVYLHARHDLGLALASAGDYARARPILEEIWQRSGRRVTSGFGVFGIDSATALIAIRRDAGEKAEAGELLAAIRDNVRRYREAGIIRANPYFYSADYEDGIAYYLSGESERGLAMISKAVEDGFFIPQRDAYLQALYDDPGFAPIRAKQEARQASERERFLAIVCTDNPYAGVWQPAEGTCAQFATAGGT
jgi:TolB-like protein/Tfp pilus assembly protein PilF